MSGVASARRSQGLQFSGASNSRASVTLPAMSGFTVEAWVRLTNAGSSTFPRLISMADENVQLFFDYEHRFEAYLPKEKRRFGYFALPALVDDAIVAAIDLKTDRERQKLLVQRWTWVGPGAQRAHKRRIEEELHRFERFQLES